MRLLPNLTKQRSTHERNFTVIHNEILFKKHEDGKPISLEALGLFWRIMSLSKTWNLNMRGLQKTTGHSCARLKKLMDELAEVGYIKRVQKRRKDGTTDGFEYTIFETIDKTLWQKQDAQEVINLANEEKGKPQQEDYENEYDDIYQESNDKILIDEEPRTSDSEIVHIVQEPFIEEKLESQNLESVDSKEENLQTKEKSDTKKFLCNENPYTDYPYSKYRDTDFLCQYNINNNKITNNKITNNKNIIAEKTLKGFSANGSKNSSDTTSTFNNLKIKKTNKIDTTTSLGLTTQNNINENLAKSQQKGLNKFEKAELRRQARSQQLAQKVAEDSREKHKLEDVLDKKISHLTDWENVISQYKRELNVAQQNYRREVLKNQKKENIKKRIHKTIDKEIGNLHLALVLKDFINVWVQTGKPMTIEVYHAQLQGLRELSMDENEQIKIVQQSIKNGWLGLYPLKDKSFESRDLKLKNKVIIDKEQYENIDYQLARDAQGNILTF